MSATAELSLVIQKSRLGEAVSPLGIIFFVCLVCCLLCDFSLARSQATNSDLIQNYNELLSVRNGNPFLTGWVIASDNFYFTDLPFFVVLSFVFGPILPLIYLAPFCSFSLLLFACLTIVYRSTQDRYTRYVGMFAILFLVGLPFGPQVNTLLQPAIHSGTIALALLSIVFIQPLLSKNTANRLVLIPFGFLVFAIQASDLFSAIFLTGPLEILILVRLWLRGTLRVNESLLFVVTATGVGCGLLFISILAHNGGFKTTPSFSSDLVSTPKELLLDLRALAAAIRNLFTSRLGTLGDTPFRFLVATSRSLFLFLVIVFVARIVWRFPRDASGMAQQLMILGTAVLIVLDVLNLGFFGALSFGLQFPGASSRYVVPAYVLLAVGSILEFQTFFANQQSQVFRKVMCVSLALLAIPFLVSGAIVAAQRAWQKPGYTESPTFALASWLRDKGFSYGIGDYWTSQPLVGFTGGAIQTVPVTALNGKLVPFKLNSDTAIWPKMLSPQFVVFDPANPFGVSLATSQSTFGPPARVEHFGGYTVLEYRP